MLTHQARFRAEWVIVIGFLLIMAGFLYYVNQREYERIDQREREFLAQQAQLVGRNLVPRIRAVDRALTGFRDDLPRWATAADGSVRANLRLRQIADILTGVRTLVWMDAAGKVMASNNAALVGQDLSRQPNFSRIAANPNSHVLYLTPPYKTVLGTYSIGLARTLTRADGSFNGILLAVMDPEYFRTLLESVVPSPDARSFIVHGNGDLFMMSPDTGQWSGRNLRGFQFKTLPTDGEINVRRAMTSESLFAKFQASGQVGMVFSGKSGMFGDERMVAMQRLPNVDMSTDNDLVAVVSRGHDVVFASWYRGYQVEAGALAAFACFSIGALMVYQRRMRKVFDVANFEAQQRELATEGRQRVSAKMTAAFASMSDAVLLADTNGRAIDFNDAFVRFLRYGAKQECATGLADIREVLEIRTLAGEELPPDLRPVKRALNGESATSVTCRLKRKDIGVAWIGSYSFAPVRDDHGAIVGAVITCRDITQRMEAEAKLVQTLKDKDALLKEVHHRVKNNLQIVASLLRLERNRSTHPDTQETLITMQGRIRSMALLHGSLHRSGTLASLDLGAYLGEVTRQAFAVHQVDAASIALTLDLVPVETGMDQATPCGLLVNELISNALKHAFAPGQSGEIRIKLYPDPEEGFWRLSVGDNGAGLPPGYKEKRKASMGLQLASELAMQMGGQLNTSSLPGQGATFEVRFRLARPVALVMPAL